MSMSASNFPSNISPDKLNLPSNNNNISLEKLWNTLFEKLLNICGIKTEKSERKAMFQLFNLNEAENHNIQNKIIETREKLTSEILDEISSIESFINSDVVKKYREWYASELSKSKPEELNAEISAYNNQHKAMAERLDLLEKSMNKEEKFKGLNDYHFLKFAINQFNNTEKRIYELRNISPSFSEVYQHLASRDAADKKIIEDLALSSKTFGIDEKHNKVETSLEVIKDYYITLIYNINDTEREILKSKKLNVNDKEKLLELIQTGRNKLLDDYQHYFDLDASTNILYDKYIKKILDFSKEVKLSQREE